MLHDQIKQELGITNEYGIFGIQLTEWNNTFNVDNSGVTFLCVLGIFRSSAGLLTILCCHQKCKNCLY